MLVVICINLLAVSKADKLQLKEDATTYRFILWEEYLKNILC